MRISAPSSRIAIADPQQQVRYVDRGRGVKLDYLSGALILSGVTPARRGRPEISRNTVDVARNGLERQSAYRRAGFRKRFMLKILGRA